MVKLQFGPRRNNSVISAVLGAVVCLSLAAVGIYASLGDAELHGGIPFLPSALNQATGRVLVGGSAIFTGLLGVYALYETFALLREKRRSR